ncbi:MAG: PDZ domain-containing protein, partial [Alphaproteobacteria bacterium]|nr:PDZ domain-containing protein [Alphaproteobacteria bacterium]
APNSPAEKAGLKVGDVVMSVDGTDIFSDQEMMYRIALVPIGKQSELGILRGNTETTVTVEMQAPPETTPRDLRAIKGRNPLDGVTVGNLSPALASEINFEDSTKTGVIVLKVERARTGMNVPLQAGDVILQVNDQKITSTKQLETLMKTTLNAWQIVYQRGAQTLTLTVRM